MHDENTAETEAIEFVGKINDLSQAFDVLCQERHNEGQKKYGQLTFLGNDVTRMMIEELADTVNYCRYQAIKLMILQQALEEQISESGIVNEGEEEITIGLQSFKGVKDVGWNKGNKG